MTKLLSIVLVLTIMHSAASPSSEVSDCVVELPGDVNISGAVNAADIIYLINAIFKEGPLPKPCMAAADVNCSGSVNTTDVIFLINHIFKSGPAPCQFCQLPEWQCP